MTVKFSEELAEFVGLVFGDGSVTFRKGTNNIRFQLRGDASEDRAHYRQFVIPLCNRLLYSILGKPVSLVYDRNRNSSGISVESTKIKTFFEECGIKIGKKNELFIPDWIKGNIEYSKAFVRGLFDTDGNISFKRNNTAKSKLHIVGVVSLCSTSQNLILEVSQILTRLNLKHYVSNYKGKTNTLRAYRIGIFRPQHKVFLKTVGSHNPKHLTKFEIGKKFGHCPSKTTLEQRKQILKGFIDPLSLYSFKSGSLVVVNRASLRKPFFRAQKY